MKYSQSDSDLSSDNSFDSIKLSDSLYESKPKFTNNDFILKVVVIGDPAIGKSTMVERYIDGKYGTEPKYMTTIGVDFKVKSIKIPIERSDKLMNKECVCKLQIWDTAGQEKFKAITQSYYRGVNVFLLCFDIGKFIDDESINSLNTWIHESRQTYPNEFSVVYIVGTKADTIVDDGLKSRITSDKLIKNANNIYKSPEFVRIMKKINIDDRAKFIGVCSVTSNVFVPTFLKGNDFCNIDQMFDLIVKDYLESIDNDTFLKIKPVSGYFHKSGRSSNNTSARSRWCC